MASYDPRHFCFKCNSPHHQSYECPLNESTLPLQQRRRQFLGADEDYNSREAQRRAAKTSGVQEFVQGSVAMPWQSVLSEVEQLIDRFIAVRDRLAVNQVGNYTMDPTVCDEVHNAAVRLETEVRSYMDRTRKILPVGYKKLETEQMNHLDRGILLGKLKDLTAYRNDIWGKVEGRKHFSRNVALTIHEFKGLHSKSINCINGFIQYLAMDPVDANMASIDDQLVEVSVNLKIMENRAEFLRANAGLGAAVDSKIQETRQRLKNANLLRRVYEEKQSTCRICSTRKITFVFVCGHGCCQICKGLVVNKCHLCDNTDVWTVPKFM